MSTFKPLTPEEIANIGKPKTYVNKETGYGPNDDIQVSKLPSVPFVQTHPCLYCGHCETPNRCVRSIPCPVCFSKEGQLCNKHGFPTGFHRERWAALAIEAQI